MRHGKLVKVIVKVGVRREGGYCGFGFCGPLEWVVEAGGWLGGPLFACGTFIQAHLGITIQSVQSIGDVHNEVIVIQNVVIIRCA